MQYIKVYEGENKVLNGQVFKEDRITPFNGTGYELNVVGRLRNFSTPVIGPFVSSAVSPQIEWVNSVIGTYKITLTVADTTLDPGNYEMEVRLDDLGGEVGTVSVFVITIDDSQFIV